jgi:GSCFA family
MNFRTTFSIDPSKNKISYDTPVMLIGSCFASELGTRMAEGKMKVLINPSGTVYNPVSIGNTIDIILENRVFTENDLYKYKGINLSFSHYTDFSSETPSEAIDKINSATRTANNFLKQARFLFITFGTARVYRFKESDKIVSNCHKLPSSFFSREMLTVEEIYSNWNETLTRLHSFNNDIRIIFTISPVRHWKDGAHGNQLSKSILFLSVEKLLEYPFVEGYFPAYELLMDDLRDYRYYSDDMIHPSNKAIEYIWNAFAECYITPETLNFWKEIRGITRARDHHILTDSSAGINDFADTMLKQIARIENKIRTIDFSEERSYFLKIKTDRE